MSQGLVHITGNWHGFPRKDMLVTVLSSLTAKQISAQVKSHMQRTSQDLRALQ